MIDTTSRAVFLERYFFMWLIFFFFNDTATTEIYTLSLHDALPISRDSYRYVTWGGVLGLLGSVGMGIGVGYLSGPLLDLGPDLVGAAVIFAAVGLLTWHAWWMQQPARAIRGQAQHRIDETRATQRPWLACLLPFPAG